MSDVSFIKVEVPTEVKEMLSLTAKRMGVRQSVLAGLWMSMLDVNNEELREKVIYLKAHAEVERLSATRNALVERLKSKGVLQVIDEMTERELMDLLTRVKKKKRKEG